MNFYTIIFVTSVGHTSQYLPYHDEFFQATYLDLGKVTYNDNDIILEFVPKNYIKRPL